MLKAIELILDTAPLWIIVMLVVMVVVGCWSAS